MTELILMFTYNLYMFFLYSSLQSEEVVLAIIKYYHSLKINIALHIIRGSFWPSGYRQQLQKISTIRVGVCSHISTLMYYGLLTQFE